MSRRDSRVHISVRQNDTLLEFENFKKKFLFANKQITKQNCNLSLKIEELNAHISSLYVENLRLRASEIALQSQLRREREKCYRIMADAEAATHNLLKHFGIIRQSYNVPTERPPTPKDFDSPPPPRCTRPPPRSPTAPRLAQQPSVPVVSEDPEPHETSSEDNELHLKVETRSDTPLMSDASRKPRTSISRLPVPSRVASPPPPATLPLINLLADESERKRKLTRRPSGLMVTTSDHPPRPVSPAFISPIRKDVDLSDNEETVGVGEDVDSRVSKERPREDTAKKPKKEKKVKTKDDGDRDAPHERKERKKIRDNDGAPIIRLKDVTNSPRRRRAPSVTDSASDVDHGLATASESDIASYPRIVTSPLSPLPREEDPSYLPTPLPSSAVNTPVAHQTALPLIEGDGNTGGRERRTRKSVNYAEPKLNTKMRKPDSVAAPSGARPSLTPLLTPATTPVPTPTSSQRQSLEHTSPENEDSGDPAFGRPTSGQGSVSVRRAASTTTTVSKRKLVPKLSYDDGSEGGGGDGDDDGADADAEFSDFKSNWINLGSRRKSVQSGNAHDLNGNDVRRHQRETEDGRRHSLAA